MKRGVEKTVWGNGSPTVRSLFAVGVGLTAEEINPVAMSYGYDRLRFIRPVHIGDTIRTAVTITSLKEHKRPGYGIVTESLEITNQRGEVVMVCDHLLLVEKRKAETV